MIKNPNQGLFFFLWGGGGGGGGTRGQGREQEDKWVGRGGSNNSLSDTLNHPYSYRYIFLKIFRLIPVYVTEKY